MTPMCNDETHVCTHMYKLYTHVQIEQGRLRCVDVCLLIRFIWGYAYTREVGAGVETQTLGVFGGWGRVPFNEPYTPSLSTIYDGA